MGVEPWAIAIMAKSLYVWKSCTTLNLKKSFSNNNHLLLLSLLLLNNCFQHKLVPKKLLLACLNKKVAIYFAISEQFSDQSVMF